MTFLHEYVDHGLEVDLTRKPADFDREEIERLQDSAAIIIIALSLPRRLGPDAMNEDLSTDKKRCRRVLHVLKQSLEAWSKDGAKVDWRKPTDEDQVRGAALNWAEWYEATKIHLENRRAYIATYGIKTNSDWAKKAVTRLTNELSWLAYAMR